MAISQKLTIFISEDHSHNLKAVLWRDNNGWITAVNSGTWDVVHFVGSLEVHVRSYGGSVAA
jgi:hypothetical protein